MSWEIEATHSALHIAQLLTVSVILYQFIRIYRSIRSPFNLGLVLFASAMLAEILFAWSFEITYHLISEALLLIALVVFIGISIPILVATPILTSKILSKIFEEGCITN